MARSRSTSRRRTGPRCPCRRSSGCCCRHEHAFIAFEEAPRPAGWYRRRRHSGVRGHQPDELARAVDVEDLVIAVLDRSVVGRMHGVAGAKQRDVAEVIGKGARDLDLNVGSARAALVFELDVRPALEGHRQVHVQPAVRVDPCGHGLCDLAAELPLREERTDWRVSTRGALTIPVHVDERIVENVGRGRTAAGSADQLRDPHADCGQAARDPLKS